MKISYNWLKEYLDVNLAPEALGEIMTEIGLEVDGIETFESVKGGLVGLVIGEVIHKEKHQDADKLSLTKVNIGNGSNLQIVCGAPNVEKGQKVIVAPVGTLLHPLTGDAFEIKKANIRGVESEGMICAEDEIGLGEGHDGIIVLPPSAQIGLAAKDYFKVEKDVIFSIELTPNRSDATCHLGVAEDLAAALKINHGHSGKVKKPSVEAFKTDGHGLPFEVIVENAEACPRYSGVTISGLKIGPSPTWLVNRLKAIDVRPMNNIVDITNYILHELGQPLHAFDADKVAGQKIIVKNLKEGSKFITLDELERKLSREDLMICDGQSKGMCIAGVFGGVNSGVSENTTKIFLESAHFEAIQLRRSSTRHLLRTDAAKVFEKGSDPNNTVFALKRAAMMMKELAGGKVDSEIIDIYPNPIGKTEVAVKFSHITRLIGVDIPKKEIKAILTALNIDILAEDVEQLKVAVPTNKADVTREADVIEEILRIYGFNRVEIPTKVHSSLSFSQKPDPHELRKIASSLLAANGFHEIMELSISQSRYFKEIYPIQDEELVYINNTSNQHLDVMRPVMFFSSMDAVLRNQNQRNFNLRLFEFGKTYRNSVSTDIVEQTHLCLTVAGQKLEESWQNTENKPTSFFTMKSYVSNILSRVGLSGYQESQDESDFFDFGMKFHRGPQELVRFGSMSSALLKNMGIKGQVWFADFHWDLVLSALKNQRVSFTELPKYPSIRRDLTLIIDKNVNFSEIETIGRKAGKKLLRELNLFDVYVNEEKLGKGKKSYSLSFVFQDEEKTLRDKEVDKLMSGIMKTCEEKLQAIIRR